MSNKFYDTIIYGVDIETSTIHYTRDSVVYYNNGCYYDIDTNDVANINESDILKSVSFMYSYCIGCIDFESGNYINYSKGRTYEDLDKDLYEINKNHKSVLCYVHNFSYEYSFFNNNLEFFRESSVSVDEKNYLFLESNKPLFVKANNIEFRCSYLLLNKSIKKLGAEIGLEKLGYDYEILRTPTTKMSDGEWKYNYRDVEIMLKSVVALCRQNQYIRSTKDIPYTKTGIMRFNCEKNPDINKEVYIGGRKKNALKQNKFYAHREKAKNKKQLDFWESLFQGGLVYSNSKFIGNVLHDIASFDFSSDYPYQMLYRIYPSEFIPYDGDKVKKLKQCMYKSNYTNFIRRKLIKNMFNAIIVIDNIKAIYDFEPLGTSKIIEGDLSNGINCKIINGKVLECSTKIKLVCTCIDYLMLQEFYTFDLLDVEYLEIAKSYHNSNEYKRNAVLYNGIKKSEYKKYVAMIESYDRCDFTVTDIPDDYFRTSVNAESDYYNRLTLANNLYQAVKSDLNALYGDNAQHLLREHILYDGNTKEWLKVQADFEEEYTKKQQKTSYIYGLYVPAYARASILYIAKLFLLNNLDVMYIDTDSIKTSDSATADTIVNDYNNHVKDFMSKYNLDFGTLEKERVLSHFASLGAKSYIYIASDKIHATISGLPNATKVYKELLDKYDGDFESMIDTCYNYGTEFGENITNKLASTYNFITQDVEIGNYNETVVSGVVLKPVRVTMRDFNSKTWYMYAKIISKVYHKSINSYVKKTIIDLDKNNNIIVKEL